MGKTIIEKIIETHCNKSVKPGDIVDIEIDARIARDFGGANVVKNIRENNLSIDNSEKTFFTFDCNPGGSDQEYATNQQMCRVFAREYGIRVYDINSGIGTHIAIDDGLVGPGGTLISTDSHANILGAIGAFGQGMGDKDVAYAFAFGKVWFKVPPTVKIILKGMPDKIAQSKDIALAMLRILKADGLLGYSAEIYGEVVDNLSLSDRITISSMCTEMGGIIILFPPNKKIINYCKRNNFIPVYADENAEYAKEIEIDIEGLKPLISRPGHPEDVVPVSEIQGIKVDSCFIGSCTNGRFEDMLACAEILKGHKVAEGVVLKIVPSTEKIWRKCLDEGLIKIFKEAGALVGNAGCAGCANGQIGQNGPGEVTVSTGNRNFAGKQGKGEIYLASPSTVAASAIAGVITIVSEIPSISKIQKPRIQRTETRLEKPKTEPRIAKTEITGKVWVIRKDNIDTDMIYHNKYLAVTDEKEMSKYAFSNLEGWKDFPQKAKPGDIIITGKNFGCGSSRQQAVDCFKSLGIGVIIAESFGSIYERNAINSALPIMTSDIIRSGIKDGEEITVNFATGEIIYKSKKIKGNPFSNVQMEIYKRGGLLK